MKPLFFLITAALAAQQIPSDLNRVRVGERPPEFSLQGHSLAGYRGKNVVLVFYRGYW